MEDECDELRCPRCGLVIKKAGVPVNGGHFSILTAHIGSTLCRALEKGDRPLCKCACGRPVNWDPVRPTPSTKLGSKLNDGLHGLVDGYKRLYNFLKLLVKTLFRLNYKLFL